MSSTPAPSMPPQTENIPAIDPTTGLSTTEFALMLAGKPYLASDPYRCLIANQVTKDLYDFNQERSMAKRCEILHTFFRNGSDEEKPTRLISLPFFCEYGFNITMGDGIYIGPNCTILDVCPVSIGSRTMFGPNVSLYTPQHPISPEERNGISGREWASPISIGDDCWIGGSVVICPGVTIGDGTTIGAGSVVTKDIPARCVAVGNPARVVKTIPLPGEEEEEGKEEK
ncbi:hypothetical protein NliqN6_6368 [Naganishia liquefaciens]|uniref:Sugar O-acetyltransferase n=1 Tax=Naganishia liquefaciens TaxID=104408 RepID=A0A8H3YJX3_9TREE|nr:hypothetical protein NliqN6_6368 [Naganishia liquefaciens]